MAKAEPPREAFEVVLDADELSGHGVVGTLFRDPARPALPMSFAYAPRWLESRPFALDPRLPLYAGEQHPAGAASGFGVFLDAAPDRWGRMLMERREGWRARKEGRARRTLREFDFLLGVNDRTRQGALRFRRPGGPFLDNGELATPTVAELPALEAICARIEDEGVESLDEYEQWLAQLVAPGSSLGGARPKANFVDDDGALWIAKFPARQDRYDVGGWEFVLHRLAGRAGIAVPPARAVRLGARYSTFCVRRFDRAGSSRRMYASARTLLERTDGDPASYLDIAEAIARHGAGGAIETDLAQLFRRLLFNVLVSHRDDHLRNHGFLRTTDGWRLAPAFDVNPVPGKDSHVLALDDADPSPDLARAMASAAFYRLGEAAALDILRQVVDAVATWPSAARETGLSRDECERMAPAFLV